MTLGCGVSKGESSAPFLSKSRPWCRTGRRWRRETASCDPVSSCADFWERHTSHRINSETLSLKSSKGSPKRKGCSPDATHRTQRGDDGQRVGLAPLLIGGGRPRMRQRIIAGHRALAIPSGLSLFPAHPIAQNCRLHSERVVVWCACGAQEVPAGMMVGRRQGERDSPEDEFGFLRLPDR